MDVYIDKEFDIIPVWHDNAKEAEPVVFRCKAISTQQRQRLLRMGQEGDKLRVDLDMAGIFRSSVTSIKNLRVNDETVVDAGRFLELPGMDELMYEVVNEIQKRAGVRDPKKS